ncbi:sugar ABC transporter permease [Ruania alkalisoli]|uniref:Sugar ABC transporter permease n=1 Tax=Ruania alkalisoli TaxID=2779775 RepID=A0A7M1T0M7_9MICO|nr:sugar ABC transporter permease [Ruania alkalisoli]QOR72443.1 sugar ABC transporter permease [Ruania alkalisoli]
MSTTTAAPARDRVGTSAPRRRRPQTNRSLFRLLALVPFLLFGLVFAVYPLLQVARMAGSDVQIRSGRFEWEWTGLTNLRDVLADAASIQALTNTVVFVAATVIGTLVVGFVLALLVDRAVTLLPLARNVLIWPAVIAPVVVSLMWLLILSPTAGGLNKLLRTIGLSEQGWLGDGPTAMAAVMVVDIWHWTPVVFLFLYTALKGIDASVLEAARVDGAREFQVVRHIVIPSMSAAIGAVILVRIIMGVKAFDEMYLMTRGGPDGATTLVSQHIKTLFFDNLDLGEAAAFSLFTVAVTALVLALVLLVRKAVQR